MPSVRDIFICNERIGYLSRVLETVASQALWTLDLSFFPLPPLRFSGDDNPCAEMASIAPLEAMLAATTAREKTRNDCREQRAFHNAHKAARGGGCVEGRLLLSSWLVGALVEAWDLASGGGGCKSNKLWGEAPSNQR